MRALLILLLTGLVFGQDFIVRETAGLRRFGYPVRATMKRMDAGPLILFEEGKPIPAQFTTRGHDVVEIDFAVSLGPNESRRYRVEKGSAPAPSEGMRCEERPDAMVARQPGGPVYTIPKDLAGLLTQAGPETLPYLRSGSAGLALIDRGGAARRLTTVSRAQIYKSGPFACGFRFESKDPASVIEIEVPRTKSWVEVRWRAEDPQNQIAGLSADINLAIEPPRTLVDFGAGDYVYVALKPGEDTRMVAAAGKWRVDVAGQPYAAGSAPHVEGWAHVMDATRATAVSVDEFGRGSADDELLAQSDGRLMLRRNGLSGVRKTLHFWLHFVSMPVQVGAATSPQSMMSPMAVEWK